MSDVIIIILAN